MNNKIEDLINETINNVEVKVEELKFAMFELQYLILDYREKIERILKIDLHNVNQQIDETDLEFQPEELINTANAIINEIKKSEDTLDRLLPSIEKKVKSRYKHISTEIIAKKYSENISKMKEKVSSLSTKSFEIQEDVYDIYTTISIQAGTISMVKEILKQRGNTSNDTRQATIKKDEEQKSKEMKLKLLSSQNFDPNTEIFLRILIENSDLEIGVCQRKKEGRPIVGIKCENGKILYANNKYDVEKIFDLVNKYGSPKEEDRIYSGNIYFNYEFPNIYGPKSIISISNEFGVPLAGYYENFYLSYYGCSKDTYMVLWFPEEECKIDIIAIIEEKKKKLQLLKKAKALDPQKYFRLGRIYTKEEVYLKEKRTNIVVSEACLIDANIDPEEINWKPITVDKRTSEIKTAKNIIRTAKIKSVQTSVLNNIQNIFRKKEPLVLTEKNCERE